VVSESVDANRVTIQLREPANRERERPEIEISHLRSHTLPARLSEAVFLLDGDTPPDLLAGVARLRGSANGRPAEAVAPRRRRGRAPPPVAGAPSVTRRPPRPGTGRPRRRRTPRPDRLRRKVPSRIARRADREARTHRANRGAPRPCLLPPASARVRRPDYL